MGAVYSLLAGCAATVGVGGVGVGVEVGVPNNQFEGMRRSRRPTMPLSSQPTDLKACVGPGRPTMPLNRNPNTSLVPLDEGDRGRAGLGYLRFLKKFNSPYNGFAIPINITGIANHKPKNIIIKKIIN